MSLASFYEVPDASEEKVPHKISAQAKKKTNFLKNISAHENENVLFAADAKNVYN